MIAGVQHINANNVQLVLQIAHARIQAAPSARFVGTLRSQRSFGRAKLEHDRPPAWHSNNGRPLYGAGFSHSAGHCRINGVCNHDFLTKDKQKQ
jgi:hypothetical protein